MIYVLCWPLNLTLLARLDGILQEERREHFVALPAPGEKAGEKESQAIRLRLGTLEVEIPEGASRESIEAVIEALKC